MSIFLAAMLALQPVAMDECAAARTSAADRAALIAAVRGARTNDTDLFVRLRSNVENCTSERPISADLIAGALARIANGGIAVELRRVGIDSAVIDRWFARQSDRVKTNTQVTPEEGDAFVAALIREGVPTGVMTANAELAGNYLGTLIVIERVRRGLPAT